MMVIEPVRDRKRPMMVMEPVRDRKRPFVSKRAGQVM